MRKTEKHGKVSKVVREPNAPLLPASASVTFRLPPDLVEYLAQMVDTRIAKDRTDALIGCIRRHRESKAGVNALHGIQNQQEDLAEKVAGLSTLVGSLSDDVVLLADRYVSTLDALQRDVKLLIGLQVYGAEATPTCPAAEKLPVVLIPARTAY